MAQLYLLQCFLFGLHRIAQSCVAKQGNVAVGSLKNTMIYVEIRGNKSCFFMTCSLNGGLTIEFILHQYSV